MNITAVCVTWNRPEMLGRLIHCFTHQNVLGGALLILDDANQYPQIVSGRGWVLLSAVRRYATLGEKRNAAVEMAASVFPHTEGIATWDDDDVYWPHALLSVATALEEAPWAQPRLVLEPAGANMLAPTKTYATHRPDYFCYGGSWAFRLDKFREVGGFPAVSAGEDHGLAVKFQQLYGPSGDSSAAMGPWYWYNRRPGMMADMGGEGYAVRGRESVSRCDFPSVGWNGPDIYGREILAGIHDRPF